MAASSSLSVDLPVWSSLYTSGRALVGLYAGEELWGLLSLAPDSEIMMDDPSPDGVRVLLRAGGLRCRTVGQQGVRRSFSVVVGDPPSEADPFAPLGRAWDLGADFVVQVSDESVRVASLSGKVVAETQNADGVALGRLLTGGDAAEVRIGEAPELATFPTERWWNDDYYNPPPPASAATVRRLGTLALGMLGLALLAGAISWADHGHLEPALEDLRRDGQALRYELTDGAVRRSDLQALTTADSQDRWWAYDPLTDAWSVAAGEEWRSASPPRYSYRRLWLAVGNLFLIVGLALGAAALLMR